jgi:GntR family transcriptional regulator
MAREHGIQAVTPRAPLALPLPDVSLSTDSGVPLYLQLKMALRQAITTANAGVGDLLPSEPTIAEHFGISRNTARQALGELEAEGLLIRQRGRGTRIAAGSPRPWPIQSWESLFTASKAEGLPLVTELRGAAVEPLPAWAARRLGQLEGSPGLRVSRRRRIGDEVINTSENYLPERFAELVLGADLEHGSLYELLHKEFGVSVHGATRMLDAVVLDDELAVALEAVPGEPAILIEAVVWDATMAPFDCHRVWHRTGVMSLEVNVGARP